MVSLHLSPSIDGAVSCCACLCNCLSASLRLRVQHREPSVQLVVVSAQSVFLNATSLSASNQRPHNPSHHRSTHIAGSNMTVRVCGSLEWSQSSLGNSSGSSHYGSNVAFNTSCDPSSVQTPRYRCLQRVCVALPSPQHTSTERTQPVHLKLVARFSSIEPLYGCGPTPLFVWLVVHASPQPGAGGAGPPVHRTMLLPAASITTNAVVATALHDVLKHRNTATPDVEVIVHQLDVTDVLREACATLQTTDLALTFSIFLPRAEVCALFIDVLHQRVVDSCVRGLRVAAESAWRTLSDPVLPEALPLFADGGSSKESADVNRQFAVAVRRAVDAVRGHRPTTSDVRLTTAAVVGPSDIGCDSSVGWFVLQIAYERCCVVPLAL